MMRLDQKTKAWVRTSKAKLFPCGGQIIFAVPEPFWTGDLRRLLENFDSALAGGTILKDSPTTTAALVELSGQPVFLKRTNNKSFLFSLRYLFRSARAFRSAVAAEKLAQLGIPTPAVIAAGERRSGLILKCGYLVTASEPGIKGMSRAILDASDPQKTMLSFLKKAAAMMALLHKNHVVHGDLKLTNFYQGANGEPGIWDLDSVKVYSGKVPRREIEKELTRLLASCIVIHEKLSGASGAAELDELAAFFCEEYSRHSNWTPSVEVIAASVREKLARWRNKK